MHRWDFDLMATALHQRSVERASFLKELDKNMMEQSEQMDKALSAPAADETWKLSIQAVVETGKKFFAHTKELHTTEETRRAKQERWALLRRRQVLRQQLGATAAKVDYSCTRALDGISLSHSRTGQDTTGCIETLSGSS